ncbi:MAG: hypothetical protein AB1411_14120 [Nitrospirota bacterium]
MRTVGGDIPPADLGVTLPHEHLLIRRPEWPRDAILDDPNLAAEELAVFGRSELHGPAQRTLVELTPHGLRAPAHADRLRAIAQRTGVHIVMGTGFHKKPWHPPELAGWSQRTIEDRLVGDVLDGVGPERIGAGVIGEIGISDSPPAISAMDRDERKVLKAGAGAQRRTGAPLSLHFDNDWRRPCWNGPLRIAVLEYLRSEEGIDLSRVVVCHCSPIPADLKLHRRMIEMGAYVAFDAWGSDVGCPGIPEDDYRLYASAVKTLVRDEAYLVKVLLSQDVCVPRQLMAYGGCGYAHLIRDVLPRFLASGVTERQIQQMTVGNPMAMLPLRGAA